VHETAASFNSKFYAALPEDEPDTTAAATADDADATDAINEDASTQVAIPRSLILLLVC
jgi:hypothetical protein